MSDSKLALVTGASRGIGFAIAQRLSADGYQVVGTATSDEGVEKLKSSLQALGENNDAIKLDISSSEQVDEALDGLLKSHGAPNVLVNNAGITCDTLFLRMTENDWDKVINTNLTGVFRVCKMLAKPMLKKKAGSIVNISSIIGTTGNVGQVNYAAAKAGLEGFSRSLAREVASRNITVNCVAPGFIQTNMTDVLPEEQKETILTAIPGKRFGHVDDIAGAVSFLVSDDSRYITGQTIHVNGGMNMG